jgi:hypothetical protein
LAAASPDYVILDAMTRNVKIEIDGRTADVIQARAEHGR